MNPDPSALPHPVSAPGGMWRRPEPVPILLAIITIALQWVALGHYQRAAAERAALSFAHITDQAMVSLIQQTTLYQNALLGLRAHYVGSNAVSPGEFTGYAKALDIRQFHQGLRAFAFNREVRESERADYIAWIRQRLADFARPYASFDVYPTETGHDHHVVELIYPPLDNLRSLGFDLMSSAVRRDAIERARDRGFAATPPIRLQQAPGALAVLILAPVVTTDWNRHSSRDTVAASFLVRDLITASIAPSLRQHFTLRMLDLGAEDEQGAEAITLFEDEAERTAPQRSAAQGAVHRIHHFGGRRWEVRFSPRDAALEIIPLPLAFAIMGSIALLAAALASLALQRHRRNKRNQALVSQTSDCVLELEASGIVVNADESTLRITGMPPAQWIGRPLWQSAPGMHAGTIENGFKAFMRDGVPDTLSCNLATEDKPHWIEIRLGNHLATPSIRTVLAQVSDITARKAAEHEIARLAFFDPLTHLPNRRLLEQRAELTISNARRQRGRAAVLVVDLDDFKQINDNAGHATGDAVLAAVATRLHNALRDSDTVARLGGDEFVVLLGLPADEVDVRAAAERLIRDLSLPLEADGRNWFVRASIGMAMYPDHGASFAELLSEADAAMYRAKRNGGSAHAMATPIAAR